MIGATVRTDPVTFFFFDEVWAHGSNVRTLKLENSYKLMERLFKNVLHFHKARAYSLISKDSNHKQAHIHYK